MFKKRKFGSLDSFDSAKVKVEVDASHKYCINGFSISFPVKAYPTQITMMNKVGVSIMLVYHKRFLRLANLNKQLKFQICLFKFISQSIKTYPFSKKENNKSLTKPTFSHMQITNKVSSWINKNNFNIPVVSSFFVSLFS